MASLEEAKARLAQASQRFHDTEIKWQPSLWDSSDFDLRSPTGDPLGNIFSSIFGTRPLSPPAPQIFSQRDAPRALRACFDVLYALGSRSTDANETLAYASAMDAVSTELDFIAQQRLLSRTTAYAPFTAAFKLAAKTLKKAKAKADELAQNLGLAADVLTAFSKIIAVV
ncbi:MAG: hypothetical protein G4V63_26775 [Candidatus Afipia apatlaquensis]|uniref:Uncharacterized protein n=1 Tax=Candidatus Afipia apatlaquensis TaxID=2712852 RepID=A0A7C9RJ86_9BRAD|nr:hypothetical protein [Candidatus Afipia apatlaquensis]